MKKYLFHTAILYVLMSFISFSQSIQPSVNSSAGTFATSAGGSMSWTIGEVMIETYSSTGNVFTQGFHQSDTSFVISVIDNSQLNISIYPNPLVDNLIIDFSESKGNYSIHLYDVLGNLLREEIVAANQREVNIFFREFANGMYLLNIINTESNTRNSYKINKTE